jgi:hypothetical protein
MADADRTADCLWGLVTQLALRVVSIDERTPGGQRFVDQLSASSLPLRLLDLQGAASVPGAPVDLLHVAGVDHADALLGTLDRAWPALSERALVVLEGSGVDYAARTFHEASGAAWLQKADDGLVVLTENGRLAEACRQLGWTVVKPYTSPVGSSPPRRARLVERPPPPAAPPRTIRGDTPELAAAAAVRFERPEPPNALRRHFLEDMRVFGDMTVLGPQGPLREMRRLVSREQSLATQQRLGGLDLPDLQEALLIGVSAHSNYFHWMVESLFTLWLARRSPGSARLPAITAQLDDYQSQSLELLRLQSDVLALQPEDGRDVKGLVVYSPVFGAQAFSPSPRLQLMFEELLASARATAEPISGPRRRLFISRRDSPSRPLENEAALAEALQSRGFASVILSGKSVAEQALLLSHAEIVVAAHGAGLTNLGFCPPDTRVLELTPGHYINPCFVAITALSGIEHHVYVGSPHGNTPLRHRRHWSVDIDGVLRHLNAVLAD